MTREIRFRAWDKNTETMHELAGFIRFKQFTEIHFGPSGFKKVPSNQIELMQFTGLKDKNGKDIYEGDVVQDEYTVFEIIWNKGRFDFKRLSGACQYPYFGDNCSRMEVIGDIHTGEIWK